MPKLLASGVRTVSGVSSGVYSADKGVLGAVFQLNVTAAATLAGDTLDVYVQHSTDTGATWDDFVHFTQVLGNGGVKRFLAFWSALLLPAAPLRVPADAALAAGVLQGPVATFWRSKWVIAGTGSFTFEVTFSPSIIR